MNDNNNGNNLQQQKPVSAWKASARANINQIVRQPWDGGRSDFNNSVTTKNRIAFPQYNIK